VSDYVLRWLVYFAQQFIKNRHFPDKAVDLLEHGEITAEIAEIKEKQEKMGKMLRFLKREN